MKKALLMMVVVAAIPVTTGCGAKQRVKALEAELTRCNARRAQLRSSELETPPTQEQEHAQVAQLEEPH